MVGSFQLHRNLRWLQMLVLLTHTSWSQVQPSGSLMLELVVTSIRLEVERY